MKMGIFEFINIQRIQLAKNLIATSILKLSEVAERVGFTDYNYFARVFSATVGTSPRKYQNEIMNIK